MVNMPGGRRGLTQQRARQDTDTGRKAGAQREQITSAHRAFNGDRSSNIYTMRMTVRRRVRESGGRSRSWQDVYTRTDSSHVSDQ